MQKDKSTRIYSNQFLMGIGCGVRKFQWSQDYKWKSTLALRGEIQWFKHEIL